MLTEDQIYIEALNLKATIDVRYLGQDYVGKPFTAGDVLDIPIDSIYNKGITDGQQQCTELGLVSR
jgi:hypothetical protein